MRLLILLLLLGLQTAANPDMGQAIALYERGDFAGAAQWLARKCQEQKVCGEEARLWLGQSYLKLRRWDEAIAEMKAAVEQSPSNGLAHLWLGRAYGEKAAHASFIAALGPARKVADEFLEAQKLDPSNTEIRFDLLHFFLRAPGFIGGGRDKAVSQASSIEQISQRLGFTARAIIHEHDRKWPEARMELIQATVKFPKDPEAFGDLAEFHFKRNACPEAEAAAERALTLRPGYPLVRMVKAACLIQQGQELPAAEAMLKQLSAGPLSDSDPSFEDVYHWLGMAYLAAGKNGEAREAFSTALRYAPDHKGAKSALSKTQLQ